MCNRCLCLQSDKEVYLLACIALVDEIEWEIEKVDPKKTLQVPRCSCLSVCREASVCVCVSSVTCERCAS